MIKHIILTSNYSPWSVYSGGGQRSTHNIAVHLCNMGYTVDVVYSKPFFDNVDAPNNLPYNIHWANYPGFKSSRRNLFRFFSIFSVRRIVKKLITNNTIIHCNGEEGALLAKLKTKSTGLRLVITPRYPSLPESISNLPPTLLNAFAHPAEAKYILLHKCLVEFDCVCPTSQSTAEMLADLFRLDKNTLKVVPNGIADEFFNTITAQPSQTLPNKIIFFGRLSAAKGIDTLLESCRMIGEIIGHIYIIGRGEFEEEIVKQNNTEPLQGKISLIPWLPVPELISYLHTADIAVLPSREESFGNSIAEAMASRLAVVTTNAGSIPEIVGNAENAIVVEPGNPAAIAHAVKYLIEHPIERLEMAANGYNKVKNDYSWEKTVQKYMEIYDKLSVQSISSDSTLSPQ